MPEIVPFEALRYSDELLRDASSLICPPYDVITPDYQKELYGVSSCNAVRLELPSEADPYAAAAERLREWLLEGELVKDSRPALYPYFQTFADPEGNKVMRCGFFAAMRLSEPSEKKVLPHEKTLSGPKADRLNLFRKTRANISPVFGIYADESGTGDRLLKEYAASHEPVLEAELQGVENRMWRITEPELLAELQEVLLERTVYIADGHHRYATGLNYRNERAEANTCHTGEEPYNFILTYLANMYDEGLLIFPIHRVVHGLADFDAEALLGKLGEKFSLTELDGREALKEFMDREQSSYAYGVSYPDGWLVLFLRGVQRMCLRLRALRQCNGLAWLCCMTQCWVVCLALRERPWPARATLCTERMRARCFGLWRRGRLRLVLLCILQRSVRCLMCRTRVRLCRRSRPFSILKL